MLLEQLKNTTLFTPVEQSVCDYILAHPDQISDLSISELSQLSYSSNATIIRLCRKLGLKGYSDFKINLVKELERMRKEKQDVNMNFPFIKKESTQEIINRIAVLSNETIHTCYESISSIQLEKAAQLILKANHLFVYAAGDSLISATSFVNRLVKLKKHAFIANQYGEMAAMTETVTAQDLVLFVSYSGAALPNKRIMHQLKRSGCKTLFITSNDGVYDFDVTILFPKREDFDHKIATFYSQISINYIFHCLYAIVYSIGYQ
ncbi:MAG: MurR/RpiR family transcriptional regulator [Beduini sp.]|uniref:MurR/RpiR family transcriptional regulator n=1 Tax=Beduini sp. TaxID=1922300 RepID=UPI0011C8C105